VPNASALLKDPRKWVVNGKVFTPYDIAHLNHVYEMGKTKKAQGEKTNDAQQAV
jgi:hypothetical protein